MNILLAHGVLGFSKFGGVRYFNRVAGHLRAKFPGARVRTSIVPALGTVATRAHALAEQIERGFHAHDDHNDQLDHTKRINIIAHSMGGLDARFVLAKRLLSPQRRVATLTCIGTPHFGSRSRV